jgi:hypothetical protein
MTTGLPLQVPIDLLAQFGRVTDYWSPKVVTRVNDQYVKVADRVTAQTRSIEEQLAYDRPA